MGRIGRWVVGLAVLLVITAWPIACTQHHIEKPPSGATPIVRVRLIVGETAVTLRADSPPTVKTASETQPLRLNIAPGASAVVELSGGTWKIGGVAVPGRGEMVIAQSQDASVRLNDKPYRGSY